MDSCIISKGVSKTGFQSNYLSIHQHPRQHKMESPRRSEDERGLSPFVGGATRN